MGQGVYRRCQREHNGNQRREPLLFLCFLKPCLPPLNAIQSGAFGPARKACGSCSTPALIVLPWSVKLGACRPFSATLASWWCKARNVLVFNKAFTQHSLSPSLYSHGYCSHVQRQWPLLWGLDNELPGSKHQRHSAPRKASNGRL